VGGHARLNTSYPVMSRSDTTRFASCRQGAPTSAVLRIYRSLHNGGYVSLPLKRMDEMDDWAHCRPQLLRAAVGVLIASEYP